MNQVDVELKFVVVGDSDVGKTSLSSCFCHGTSSVPDNPTPTIGASFLQKRVPLSIEKAGSTQAYDVLFQIWDTAGQERFRSMAPMYYRGAKAALIVVDATNPATFACLSAWKADLLKYADESVAVVVAFNKTDQEHDQSQVSEAVQALRSDGVSAYSTSAKTGLCVDDAFLTAAKQALMQQAGTAQGNPASHRIEAKSPAKGGCC